jgi:cytochrome P450
MARWPEQLAKVQADPALIPRLVEEAVRWTSPVKHFMRSASADTEIRGRHIQAGDRLMLLYGSANRDEEVFEDPDVFNVERPVKHVAFGAGPHTCVGMHVAKLEMRILFEELLPRIKGIEVTGQPKLAQTNFVGGMKRLPVRLVKA